MAGTATRCCSRKGKVRDMRRLALPGAEPRGALVVDLDLPAGPLRLVAAHLGLLRRSRRWQVRSILDAIEHGPRMPILLVGDLNEWRPGRKSSLHELRPVFGPLAHSAFFLPVLFPCHRARPRHRLARPGHRDGGA